MNLARMHVPLSAFPGEDPAELRERLLSALRACAARSLPGRTIDVRYDDDAERFTVFQTVAITDENLEAASAFGPVDPGDELGLDIWDPTPEASAFLGLDPLAREDFCDRAQRAVRLAVTEARRKRAQAAPAAGLAKRRKKLARWRRTAWQPVVQAGDVDPRRAEGTTYYGGPAWLRGDEPWPACGGCGAAMELLLHLDVAASPFAAGVSPAYEVFQCTSCGAGELARAVPEGAAPRPSPVLSPRCEPKLVVEWRRADDYSGFAADDAAFTDVMALRGDKLGGWPARIQGSREEPFPCPTCGGDTTLLYQLDSDSYSGWMWGDSGRAWLSACPRHPARPLYFWECS